MKGLILNDIFSSKKLMKTMVIPFIIFGVIWGLVGQPGTGVVTISVLCISSLYNLFSYDEFYHWDKYTTILPLDVKQVVLARYCSFGIMIFVSQIIALIYLLILGGLNDDGIGSMAGSLLIQIYTGIVIIPVAYKYGIQRGRVLYAILIGLPFLVILGIVGLLEKLQILYTFPIPLIVIAVLLLLVISLCASIKISTAFLRKKEY